MFSYYATRKISPICEISASVFLTLAATFNMKVTKGGELLLTVISPKYKGH